MKKPKFSIIMPIILTQKYHQLITTACINNIHAFSYDYELIVLHSFYNTSWARYLEPLFRKEDTYLKYDYNLSPVKSINKGIKMAKGDYVVLIGNDNFVHQNWLKEIDKRLGKSQYKILACCVDRIWKEDPIAYKEKYKETDYIKKANFSYVNQQGVTISKNIIKDVGLFDENLPFYYYEMDYNYRLANKKYMVGVVLDSLMTTPQNMTRVGDLNERRLPEGIDDYWTAENYKMERDYYKKKWGKDAN